MDEKPHVHPVILNDRYQSLLRGFSKCKINFITQTEEIKKVREINARLEAKLKESRELEKSHRYHLQISREMIGNLQETVSQLIYLKRDVNKLKEEIAVKDSTIVAVEKEKESIIQKHSDKMKEIQDVHEKQIHEITAANERSIQQVQHDSDSRIAQFTCVIEELRTKIQEMESEHRDKINVAVLDYEEKIQRSTAQVSQLQQQLAQQAARFDANIDAYRKRLEDLEEKLKQKQIQQQLAQSSYSQYENHVERPYSVERNFPQHSVALEPQRQLHTPVHQNKGRLQVMYYGDQTPHPQQNEKKGQFSISKKRKLYNPKDSLDM